MKKSDYLQKLQYDNKKYINNIYLLMKTLEFKIAELKKSKEKTDKMCRNFDISCYNYNLVNEMQETKQEFIKRLNTLTKVIEEIVTRKSRNTDYDIQKITSINDLLVAYEVQLNSINKIDLSNIEVLQMNAIKKEIHEKYMRYKAEIDKKILTEKYDKMQNRNALLRAMDDFFLLNEKRSVQKENLFMAIQGIDDYRFKLKEASIPDREYKIVDILAEIEVYLNENKQAKKYKELYNNLTGLREMIKDTFSIDRLELKKAIGNVYKSKLPMPVEKNMNRMIKMQKKAMEFLYKSGYTKTYSQTVYKSRMTMLIEKIKLLSDNVQSQIDK